MTDLEDSEEFDRGGSRGRLRAGVAWALATLSLAVLDLAAWIHPTAKDIEVDRRV